MAYTESLASRTAGAPDPGAVDNRLSLDPNDPAWADVIANWEDGATYHVVITDDEGGKIKADLQQISPGEFEVIGKEAPEAPETEEEAAPAPRRVNRAVRTMPEEV